MALAVLSHQWARRRGGSIIALTVDHGLRAGSRGEAKDTRRRLEKLDIECHLLAWRGVKPTTGIQAAARNARYELMTRWCGRHSILHLLVAHHQEDQAETILHRLARSSGTDGLAGMAAIHELPDVRILRPCLSVSRDRLRAVLLKRGIGWAEDPSNANIEFARVRLRALLPALAAEGLDAAAFSGTARRVAAARGSLDAETARFLACHAVLFPEGYARLDRAAFTSANPETARRVLIALLATIGGNAYPPRQSSIESVCEDLRPVRGKTTRLQAKTLGGCRILPAGTDYLICREAGRCDVVTAVEGAGFLWDWRFFVRLPAGNVKQKGKIVVKALGGPGWAAIKGKLSTPKAEYLPNAVRLALPALYERGRVVAVPHLDFYNVAGISHVDVRFMPVKPATSAGFPVV